MVNTQLFINDSRADLSEDIALQLTIAVNDIAEIKDRQSTYSNNIKLPKTSNNLLLFGNPQSDAFTQVQPYRALTCKLIQNGVEIIVSGIIRLSRISDYLETQVTYGLSGFADSLKHVTPNSARDAKLTDLDWSGIPKFYNTLSSIVASQTNQSPLWAVIDYGGTLSTSSTVDVTYLRPGILYSQILPRIAAYTGYKFYGGANYTAGFNDYIPFSEIALNNYQGTSDLSIGIDIVHNLPDFTLKDIIKDYMQRYFLTPIVDNYKKTIYFRSFDELYLNKAQAKQPLWLNQERSDSFDLGNYAQNNSLLWKDDEPFFTGADGLFSVDNQNLDLTSDLVTSIFAGTNYIYGVLGGKTVATIKKFESSPLSNSGTTPTIETKPRVVRIEQAQGTYQFYHPQQGTQNTAIKIGVSYTWNDYLSRYGTGFLRMLKKARSVSRYALLTERDLKDFDFFTPLYDPNDSKYYYVNSIKYQPGRDSQLSLTRM